MACLSASSFQITPHGFHAVWFEATAPGALAFSFTAGCGSEKRGGRKKRCLMLLDIYHHARDNYNTAYKHVTCSSRHERRKIKEEKDMNNIKF